jgi:hypothetical protein
LMKHQGQGGIPALPASAKVAPMRTSFAASAPPPDRDASAQINQQVQQADRAEQDALGPSPAPNPRATGAAEPLRPPPPPARPPPAVTTGAPPTLTLDMTVEQVTALMGVPKSIANLGTKSIYVYPDIKITFTNGKVSDIQ